jgi:hypothetical protein
MGGRVISNDNGSQMRTFSGFLDELLDFCGKLFSDLLRERFAIDGSRH